MQTTRTSAGAALGNGRLNAVRRYVVYSSNDMPGVEVCVSTGSDGTATWALGELRMHTQHEDGSRTFTAQYRLDGRLMIDNFPQHQVRRDPAPPDRRRRTPTSNVHAASATMSEDRV